MSSVNAASYRNSILTYIPDLFIAFVLCICDVEPIFESHYVFLKLRLRVKMQESWEMLRHPSVRTTQKWLKRSIAAA